VPPHRASSLQRRTLQRRTHARTHARWTCTLYFTRARARAYTDSGHAWAPRHGRQSQCMNSYWACGAAARSESCRSGESAQQRDPGHVPHRERALQRVDEQVAEGVPVTATVIAIRPITHSSTWHAAVWQRPAGRQAGRHPQCVRAAAPWRPHMLPRQPRQHSAKEAGREGVR
jgi:hypothetical protein